MPRALGSNAKAFGAFEAVPGTPPAVGGAWFGLPFVSHNMGETRPLLPPDLLGQGREMQDPTPDVATNDGDFVVPVDVRNIGRWLKLAFGAPVDTAGQNGEEVHTFASGAATLPSMSIEVGAPEIPAFSTHRGCRLNQLKITQGRSGLLNATMSLIAIGETPIAAVSAANPGAVGAFPVTRFPNATGYVMKDGQQLGSVVGADITISNNLEKVETIQPDGRIEDSDPGMVEVSASVTVRFKDTVLYGAATNGTPMELDLGWVAGPHGLVFKMPRVFLPATKRPVTGPKGIQAQFNCAVSGANAAAVTAVLTNDVPSYA